MCMNTYVHVDICTQSVIYACTQKCMHTHVHAHTSTFTHLQLTQREGEFVQMPCLRCGIKHVFLTSITLCTRIKKDQKYVDEEGEGCAGGGGGQDPDQIFAGKDRNFELEENICIHIPSTKNAPLCTGKDRNSELEENICIHIASFVFI